MKKLTTITLILIIFPFIVQGQGWEKTYEGYGFGHFVQPTIDGGYIITGNMWDNSAGAYDIFLIKTNVHGDTLWTKTYGGSNYDYGKEVQQTSDGGYIICGHTRIDTLSNYEIYLIKTDSYGDTLWTKIFAGAENDKGNSVKQTNDGGYIVAGLYDLNICLIKTNATGDTLWTKNLGGTRGNSVQQTTDLGYIVAGDNGGGAYLAKTNIFGDTLWTKTFASFYGFSVQQTTDGGFIIAGQTNPSPLNLSLIKTDSNGDTLWTKVYGGSGWDAGYSVQQATDGGYIVAGLTGSYGAGGSDVWLIKTDVNGDSLWTKKYGGTTWDWGHSISKTTDGGYIIACEKQTATETNVYLIKTDSLGNTYTNIISGNIFIDDNTNCVIDSADQAMFNRLVKIEPGPLYTNTDTSGYYEIRVDTGIYTVKHIVSGNLWNQNCPLSPDFYTINFTSYYDTVFFNNFANEIVNYCPYLEVDIATWALHPCMNSTYTVSYCNNGTMDATNVYIEVEFDSVVTPVSSTLPWSSQNGNIYTFNINTVDIGQCGTFYITVDVSCNAVMGSTHCITAQIFPDSLCTPVDSLWDKSSVSVVGQCLNDSTACFTIYNTGDFGVGDMEGTSDYRIYENNILVNSGIFQILGGDSIIICWTANGNTIRLEADQRPGHPGNSHPQANVELCGGPPTNLGEIIVVPEDDQDHNIEIDCREITGSYDPNEKQVKPLGLANNHYIDSTDVLEYHINFQNTGTDTAIYVVIRDTLTEYLDITTVQTGASSHPYTFKIYNPRILEWTFDNILLPDSNINESASHGFVKFKINQIAGNQIGTIIENQVGIIFDFNAPVITNQTSNTVWDMGTFTISIPNIYSDDWTKILIYPNPTTGKIKVESEGVLGIEVINIQGELIINQKSKVKNQKCELDLSNHAKGIYIIKVITDKQTITRKLIKQ
ncbi:MAG: T9SS type A sorting domain-containing protein [Bacteroidota bacterium]